MTQLKLAQSTPPSLPPPRQTGLTWSDFQFGNDVGSLPTSPDIHRERNVSLEQTISKLRRERFRFTKSVPNDLNSKICCPRDRGAVLDIYAEALSKITPENHRQIYAEAKLKIKTVLGISKAGPRNEVFKRTLLAPIEPLYAMPRIEFRMDKFGHRAATRLQEWREDGWPDQYPENAVKKERARKGKLKGWVDENWQDEWVEERDEEKRDNSDEI
ncbi:hypothetical protein COCMIDRAFT_111030 [Bipolaris oryzae ATCC 44560]|uniref:Uncharacterized protein n=1 Tax=Bipolaris oryzae ATCC 44560 TaxID=930090 RepID=W6Z7E7_COCMI|nr:uncharacterized protein COCMIDRAFT_111030 [Bipolaris oryzae ATCC 44560]EUC39621.1 hypothetical protein COCMIDRAFT_111030 [Bipolaris oryzae ATCC 44560]